MARRAAPRWQRRRRGALGARSSRCCVACRGVPRPARCRTARRSRVPKPAVAISAPGKCVEDTQFMRRNHMELLKHHRDRTVREGIRTTQHSLANCVTCHAEQARRAA